VADYGVEIRGLKELRAKLKRMDDSLQDEMRRTMIQATALVQRPAQQYPAKRPESSYRRTGTLGKTITSEVKSVGNDTVGTIGTDLVYAPWVIGHKVVGGRGPQARIHQGTWKTLKAHLDARRGEIRELFKEMVRRWLKR